MKRLCAIFLLSCILFGMTACGREEMKTIYLLETVYCQDTRSGGRMEYYSEENTYDENGAMLSHKTNDAMWSITIWTVETDEFGRVVKMTGTNSYGTDSTWLYTYDTWGNVYTLSKYIGEHRQNHEVNVYDANGNLLSQEFWISDDLYETEYIYADDRLVQQVKRHDGEETGKVLYCYDEQGRVKTETCYGRESVTEIQEYSYSEDGRTTYIDYSRAGKREELVQDENGNLILRIVYNEDGEIVYRYEYTYRAVQIPADWPRKNG